MRGRYGGAVAAIFSIARRAERSALLGVLVAIGLTIVGELEVLLAGDDGRLLRALTLPVMTLPLAWRRRAPLLPLVAVAAGFLVQASLGEFYVAEPLTPLVAIVLAVYAAGRYVEGDRALAGAAIAVLAVAATRIAFDEAAQSPATPS